MLSATIPSECPQQAPPERADGLRAGIVGLGLIGGSIARALRQSGTAAITACDRNAASLRQAEADGTADRTALLPDAPAESLDFSILQDADIVFICTPAETVPAFASRIARFCPGLLTDVASTKAAVCAAVQVPRFIGGHPMAGSERFGYGASSAGLFENAVYVLCPPPEPNARAEADLALLERLVRRIGALPLRLAAAEHDRAVAAISHLPHVAAAALCLLAGRAGDPILAQLAAGGFRDITRIASSDADLWTSICRSAKPALLPLLDRYHSLVGEFAAALEADDAPALRRLFAEAAAYRDSLPVDGRGALEALSSLTVRIPDHPGVLGRVTTLLGERGLNIKNIRIRDVRTYEGGVLQILLPDSRQAQAATVCLKEAGYDVD